MGRYFLVIILGSAELGLPVSVAELNAGHAARSHWIVLGRPCDRSMGGDAAHFQYEDDCDSREDSDGDDGGCGAGSSAEARKCG